MSTRCAIYTRKSSEEGLDMAFNSLDAQREAGVDYIKSQKHEGWVAVETRYDDGGYSGGTTDRPGLRKLMADIERGRVDVVLVYKVDRLSRSLADFARLMQTFDQHKVSFVSVTQQFNTTTSMGRLTLNMLLSFAQFEREVAGERIRDKIAATKRRGVWVCGQPPLGYRLEGAGDARGLRVVPEEADLVRLIYRGYAESGSLVELAAALRAKGHTTKRWQSSRGVRHGGKPLSAATLYRTLTNPVYTGQIAHTRGGKTELYPGLHDPIIDRSLWDRVQARMTVAQKDPKHRQSHTHLLAGKIRTFEGHAMSPSSVQRPGSKSNPSAPKRIVRYYVSQKAIKQGYEACPVRSVNAAALEECVRNLVLDHLGSAHQVGVRALNPSARDQLLRDVLVSLTVAPDHLAVVLDLSMLARGKAAPLRAPGHSGSGECRAPLSGLGVLVPEVQRDGPRELLTVRVPLKSLSRRALVRIPGGELLDASAGGRETSPSDGLVHSIGLAYLWHRELQHHDISVEALARRHGCSAAQVHRLLRLTCLGPDILRDALGAATAPCMRLADALTVAGALNWHVQLQRRRSRR